MSDQTLTTADLSEYSALSIDALGRVFQPEWIRTFEPNINRNQQRHWARQRAIRERLATPDDPFLARAVQHDDTAA